MKWVCCRDDTYSLFIRPFSRFVDVEIKWLIYNSQRRAMLNMYDEHWTLNTEHDVHDNNTHMDKLRHQNVCVRCTFIHTHWHSTRLPSAQQSSKQYVEWIYRISHLSSSSCFTSSFFSYNLFVRIWQKFTHEFNWLLCVCVWRGRKQ